MEKRLIVLFAVLCTASGGDLRRRPYWSPTVDDVSELGVTEPRSSSSTTEAYDWRPYLYSGSQILYSPPNYGKIIQGKYAENRSPEGEAKFSQKYNGYSYALPGSFVADPPVLETASGTESKPDYVEFEPVEFQEAESHKDGVDDIPTYVEPILTPSHAQDGGNHLDEVASDDGQTFQNQFHHFQTEVFDNDFDFGNQQGSHGNGFVPDDHRGGHGNGDQQDHGFVSGDHHGGHGNGNQQDHGFVSGDHHGGHGNGNQQDHGFHRHKPKRRPIFRHHNRGHGGGKRRRPRPSKTSDRLFGNIGPILLFGLLPLGLLLAAMAPAPLFFVGRRKRSSRIENPTLAIVDRYGIERLDDVQCLQRMFCEAMSLAETRHVNVVNKFVFDVLTTTNSSSMEYFGLEPVAKALRLKKCSIFKCDPYHIQDDKDNR